MPFDDHLLDRMRPIMARLAPGCTEKRMFGGVAFMVNDRMSCGITNKGMLMTRVVKEKEAEALAHPHVRPMDFTGKPMKGFLFIDAEGTDRDADLEHWCALGVEQARAKA
jgi:hypothetical protein